MKNKKSKARLSNLDDVLFLNKNTILLNQKGNQYSYINDNNECLYEKIINKETIWKQKIQKNEIYLAQLDRNKSTKQEYWKWKREREKNNDHSKNININSSDDSVDPITIGNIDKKERFLGILVKWNKNNNDQENKNFHDPKKIDDDKTICWKKVCDHVFAYESIKEWFLNPNFNGCPICRAGQDILSLKRNNNDAVNNYFNEEEQEENIFEAVDNGNLEKIKRKLLGDKHIELYMLLENYI